MTNEIFPVSLNFKYIWNVSIFLFLHCGNHNPRAVVWAISPSLGWPAPHCAASAVLIPLLQPSKGWHYRHAHHSQPLFFILRSGLPKSCRLASDLKSSCCSHWATVRKCSHFCLQQWKPMHVGPRFLWQHPRSLCSCLMVWLCNPSLPEI